MDRRYTHASVCGEVAWAIPPVLRDEVKKVARGRMRPFHVRMAEIIPVDVDEMRHTTVATLWESNFGDVMIFPSPWFPVDVLNYSLPTANYTRITSLAAQL